MAFVRGEFHQESESFSNLKIRAGWGQTGNAGSATSLSVPQLSSLNCMYYMMIGGSMTNGAGIAQQRKLIQT